MQPPPRNEPPGASGPPSAGAGPNAFRRTRPLKHTSTVPAAMMGPQSTNHPMTDPFAFGMQAPPPMASAAGPPMGHNTVFPQIAPSSMYSQAGPGMHPQPVDPQQAAASAPHLSYPAGVNLFTPQGVAPPTQQHPGQLPVHVTQGYTQQNSEQGYFNSIAQPPPTTQNVSSMASNSLPSQPYFHQDHQGERAPQAMPFQPVPPTTLSSHWSPDHGSRPPSLQNYFQPTTDPPPQPFNMPHQLQAYPSHTPSPHQNAATPPAQPEPPQAQAPLPQDPEMVTPSSQWPDPNVPQQHISNFQGQSYFSQGAGTQETWFNQPPQDPVYHQMGIGISQNPTRPTSVGPQRSTPTTDPLPGTAPLPYAQDSGSVSMFFRGSDVENEETLAEEGKKAVNDMQGSGQLHSHPPLPPLPHSSQAESPPVDYHGATFSSNQHLPYMNEGHYTSPVNSQKPCGTQFDHVENLEYVPNQEVLPSKPIGSPAAEAGHVDHYEAGPNLETPDTIPRPMRSASVSSSYSNVSHGSGTGSRRHQGVMGTFIQQESPRLMEDPNIAAAAGGYFEQIDTSPAADMGAHHSTQEHMHDSQPPTPSPPKPTGVFQASANSSFEPVRSHGVGVRPVEVDRAKMVAEGGGDAAPGNLEQPPDNIENIYRTGHPLATGPGVPHLVHPVVLSHSRPSSRAFGANRPCESPATTLWAQNDPSTLGANILLAPAAPPVLAPLREPSNDVIQPPEDGPLDLQPPHCTNATSQQHSENLENPPKVSVGDLSNSQGHLGYASLLVSDTLHQPVLIAPPVSNYTVIPPNAQATCQRQETSSPMRPPSQGHGASIAQPPLETSNQNQSFMALPMINPSAAPSPGPLNLARDQTECAKSETAALPLSQAEGLPLFRAQSMGGESLSALPIHSQHPPVTAPAPANHSQLSNYELLDFSMHQSQSQTQASGHPSSLQGSPQASNAPGFYLQVTKDAQQGLMVEGECLAQAPVSNAALHAPEASPTPEAAIRAALNTKQPLAEHPKMPDFQPTAQGPAVGGPPSVHGQYPPSAHGGTEGNGPASASASPAILPSTVAAVHLPGPQGPVPPGAPQPNPAEPPRPPSSVGSQGYGPAPGAPVQGYGGFHGGAYGEYPDGRAPYLHGQYPPPPGDPRPHPYYHDDPYRRLDPWYGRYEGQNPAYRDPNYQYREPPPERPSSRSSQYSDRSSSRQGYPEDYQRANRSAYEEYYADYYKKPYDYSGYNAGTYDPRYRGYYDPSYWYNYDESYRGRDSYYNQQQQQQPQQPQQPIPSRQEGYDDQWRYYPGYDTSFDDDYRRRDESCLDDFDRRSVHSEMSAHSLHSNHTQHSRHSASSVRSQQSQVYRSQPDLVSAVYDTTASTRNDPFRQYQDQTDASQSYTQYPYTADYNADSTWIAPEQPPPRPATPEKFTIPHRCARFGPGGHLVQVLANLPSAGQPALVDIYNMETMLQDTNEQAELRSFPGPLVKEETHKGDVIKFSQNKALECVRNNDLLDRDSACLLWDFIMLLCRQNGTVVGTDIADLLLKEHRSVWLPGKSPNEANLIDFNNEPLERAEEEPGAGPLSLLSDTFMTVPENVGKETERFRELLLFGRKKDALEAAMRGGLWGHALLLASKMDNRTHARVMTRFANSLPINDPLQTVYQLMSGRMPASAISCGEEKWGDWRPHLAMVLSNLTHTLDLDTRTITTMGDTLASKGLVDAAHFCYLMAQVGLGVYTKKSTKMVLVGSNHNLTFYQFASNEAIQRTEAYEYAQSLGSQPCSLPNFQVFKLIYACRLAEAGLSAQAFHYCEVISKSVLTQPSYHSSVIISQLIQLSEKLRFYDPQLKEKPEQELFIEPEWLLHLRRLDQQVKSGAIAYNSDRATPTQYDCASPSSELEQPSPAEPYNNIMPLEMNGASSDNPLMRSLLPGSPPQAVQLMPPAPSTVLQEGVPQQHLPSSDVIQFYPVAPSLPGPTGQISGYPPQVPGSFSGPPPYEPQQSEQTYPPPLQQSGISPPHLASHMPHQMNQPAHQINQPPPHLMNQQPPHHMNSQPPHPINQPSPHQMNQVSLHRVNQASPSPGLMPPSSPGHMTMMDQHVLAQPESQPLHPMSNTMRRNSFTPQMDFYDQMAHMGPGRRSRTSSQSSMHMGPGRRSRTTSESSTHSGGRERSSSAMQMSSSPPPSIPEQPPKDDPKKAKKDSPKKGGGAGGGWLSWLYRKGKNEAHLPDDKNKSIVWDEKRQKWVDQNEPEEESKPLPPPPPGFPKIGPPMLGPGGGPGMGPGMGPGGGPPVNMFSRKAGTKSRYVDVLNPGKTLKPGGMAPAPADIFAPLAPMPTNLFVPGAAVDQQPLEASEGGNQEQSAPDANVTPQMFNPTLMPPGRDGLPMPESGEEAPPAGGVTFYNPAQFAQPSAQSGGPRAGRFGGQRQYPVVK